MIRVIINGFSGKMGQAVYASILARPNDFVAVAGVSRHCKEMGGDFPIPIYSNITEVTEQADAVIDFSRPDAVYGLLPYCCKNNYRAIIGTTGYGDDEKALLDKYAAKMPIFFSRNMSLGVNLQLQLVKRAASTLGEGFEPEIVEKHHHLKVDSPSGTALMLADAISSVYPDGRKYMYGRYTKTERRKPYELGIHSVRGGTIVGEHEVYFIGNDEILEINHKSYSKAIYAEGALRAAKFISDKQSGLYDMQDIVLENECMSNLYAVDGQALICVSGLSGTKKGLAAVFSALSAESIFVDMISVSGFNGVSFTVKAKQLFDAVNALESLKKDNPKMSVTEYDNVTKLTIEGIGMEFSYGIAAQIFEVLKKADIQPLIVTTSETKVAVGVESICVPAALSALDEQLDL